MKKRITAFLLCTQMVLFTMFQVTSVVMAEEENTAIAEDVSVEKDTTAEEDIEIVAEEGEETKPENEQEWLSYDDFLVTETTKAWNDPAMYVGYTAMFNVDQWIDFRCTSGFDVVENAETEGTEDTGIYVDFEELIDAEGKSVKVVITDFYFDNTVDAEVLWYKVEAAEGYTLPDVLVDNPYVLHIVYADDTPSLIMLPKQGMFVGTTITIQKQMVAASAYKELTVDDLPDFFDVAWADDDEFDELEWYDLGDISGWSEELTPEYRYVSASSVILIPAEVSHAYERLLAAEGTDEYYEIVSQIPEEVTSQFTDKHIAGIEAHLEYLHVIENVEQTTTVNIDGKEIVVSVTGKIPQQDVATLTVAEVPSGDVLSGGFDIKDASEIVTALDIKIINNDDGTEWQPEEGEKIWVSIGMEEFGYEDGSILQLHHKHGENIDKYEIFVVIDGKVTVGTHGFSTYVVTSTNATNGTQIGTNVTLTVGQEVIYYVKNLGNSYNIGNWFVTDLEGAIYYEVYSNDAIGNTGMMVPWIKIVPLKETSTSITLEFRYGNRNNNTNYSETHFLNIVSPKATTDAPKKLYIKDEVNTSGRITATLVDVNGNEIENGLDGAAFTWKRMDGNREMFIMPQAYEQENRSINIAKDHGGLLESKKEKDEETGEIIPDGDYVHTEYEVTAILSDGTVLSDTYTVYYQSEIINASFEAPPATAHTYTFFPNGWAGMYWKTTGPGSGENLTRDIEYVDFELNQKNEPTNDTTPPFGVTSADDGYQFAELNAEAFGTLYQDIITVPNEEVSWNFSHAARRSYENQMYIVLGPTEAAQKLATQDQLEKLAAAAKQSDTNNKLGTSEPVIVTYEGAEYSVWYHDAADNGSWEKIEGTYIAKQYRTRVFFMSETPANKRNQNYGNLIDTSKVGQYKSYLIEYYEETFGADGKKQLVHEVDYDETGEALIYSSAPLNYLKHFITEKNDYLQQIVINGGNYPYNIRYAGDASIFIDKYPGTPIDPIPGIGKDYSGYDLVVQIYLRDTIIAVQKEIEFPIELTVEQKLQIIEDMNENGGYKASFHLTSIEDVNENGKFYAYGDIPVTHRDPVGKYTGYLSLGEDPPLGYQYTVEETTTTPIVGLELEYVKLSTTLYSYGKGTDPVVEDYNEVEIEAGDVALKSTTISLVEEQKIAEVVVVNKYKEKLTKVYYKAVGNGKVALTGQTNFEDTPMEELKFYSGKAIGAAIHPGQNATFVGWYKDAACTVPVTAADGVWNKGDNSFKPNANIINADEITFYAKFETGSIVIERTNGEPGQIFVYHIQGSSGIDMYVTVECDTTGNGSRTIYEVPSGNYTVTEMEDWSWRYSTEIVGPVAAGIDKVTFSFDGNVSEDKQYWLNGYSNIEKNVYKGGS